MMPDSFPSDQMMIDEKLRSRLTMRLIRSTYACAHCGCFEIVPSSPA